MKLIADNNTNIISQLDVLESLVTWPASFKKNIPANKDGCRALSIDFVGQATLEIQILLYMKSYTHFNFLFLHKLAFEKTFTV